MRQAGLVELRLDLARQQGRTVIVVTHDTEFAKTADRVVTIVDGRIVTKDTSEEI